MTQSDHHHARRISAVWLIPLATALIGLWLVYSHLANQGPVITLTLDHAEGISAGKTAVKTRNVQVGLVESVTLSDDLSHTLLTVQMDADTERMLGDDAQFWVVKPRVSREGISGLSTVLSGSYIELKPSAAPAKHKRNLRFPILDDPPPENPGDGLYLKLTSKPGTNINNGDPVSFHSLKVGRVIETHFDPTTKLFRHRLFIEKPYDVLVTDRSRFWKTSGLDLQLGAQGIKASISSLEAMVGGGIAFAVPDQHVRGGEPVEDGHGFILHPDQESARRDLYTHTLNYVLLLERGVRGLQPGAAVEYRGIRVGTVERVPWHMAGSGPHSIRDNPVPVLIQLEPERVTHDRHVDLSQWREEIALMIENGMRASLKASNLLTGTLYVALEFSDNPSPIGSSMEYRGVVVFPSEESGSLQKIEVQINQLLKTLNSLPLNDISENLNQNLANLSAVTERVERLLADPAVNGLPQQIASNLDALQHALEGMQPGSKGYQQLQHTLGKLDALLDSAEPLLDTLNTQPNALIFQRQSAPDLEPGGSH